MSKLDELYYDGSSAERARRPQHVQSLVEMFCNPYKNAETHCQAIQDWLAGKIDERRMWSLL